MEVFRDIYSTTPKIVMKKEILFMLLGGVIGYVSAFLQHVLETNRQIKNEIRKEKIKIYSKTLSQLNSGVAANPVEGMREELSDSDYLHKFRLRLGYILSQARLVASKELEFELRKLYDLEIMWREEIISAPDSKKCWELNEQRVKQVIRIESIMRKEIQK